MASTLPRASVSGSRKYVTVTRILLMSLRGRTRHSIWQRSGVEIGLKYKKSIDRENFSLEFNAWLPWLDIMSGTPVAVESQVVHLCQKQTHSTLVAERLCRVGSMRPALIDEGPFSVGCGLLHRTIPASVICLLQTSAWIQRPPGRTTRPPTFGHRCSSITLGLWRTRLCGQTGEIVCCGHGREQQSANNQ